MKLKLLFTLYFLGVLIGWSQTEKPKPIYGKVIAKIRDLKGVNVVNLSSKKTTSTSDTGEFTIFAIPGDTLLLTAVQLKPKKVVIEKYDFDYRPYSVKMELEVVQLQEVIVNEYAGVNEVSLGIIEKKVRKFTPAERRYYTATTGSGIVSVDAIINAINGKTKRLKKEMAAEKNEKIQMKIRNMFLDDYFTAELKIPLGYIDGFVVFASEKPKIIAAVEDKNKTLVKFLLAELAVEYTKMLSEGE